MFWILFRRMVIARLKAGKNGMPFSKNSRSVPFYLVTVLIFTIHHMPRSKKYKKSFIQ